MDRDHITFSSLLYDTEVLGSPVKLLEIELISLKNNSSREAKELHFNLKSLYERVKLELKEHPPPNHKMHDR